MVTPWKTSCIYWSFAIFFRSTTIPKQRKATWVDASSQQGLNPRQQQVCSDRVRPGTHFVNHTNCSFCGTHEFAWSLCHSSVRSMTSPSSAQPPSPPLSARFLTIRSLSPSPPPFRLRPSPLPLPAENLNAWVSTSQGLYFGFYIGEGRPIRHLNALRLRCGVGSVPIAARGPALLRSWLLAFADLQCFKLSVPVCQGLGYNETTWPAPIQQHKAASLPYYIHRQSPCGHLERQFYCVRFIKPCQGHKLLVFCRHHCERIVRTCHLEGNETDKRSVDPNFCQRFPRGDSSSALCSITDWPFADQWPKSRWPGNGQWTLRSPNL